MKVEKIIKRLLFIALIIFVVHVWLGSRTITHGPGVIAPNPPEQVNIDHAQKFTYEDYTIQPLAKFEIKARVLSRKKYSSGRESELSPVDLVLGWGPMSDEAVLDKISIRQYSRWYRWSVKEFPIPQKEIERNSANMHLIPSTREIKKRLKDVKKGHLVEVEGYLVRVEGPDKWRWKSSLTRNDVGGGACELIWVEEFDIL